MSSDALINLNWLLPDGRRERMLSVRTGDSHLVRAMASIYALHVDIHATKIAQLPLASRNSRERGDIDLVVLDVEDLRGRVVGELLANTELLGRTGHTSAVPLILRVGPKRHVKLALRLREIEKWLKESGRGTIATYYVFPSLEAPLEIIPVDPNAILAWDDQVARSNLRRIVRRMIIRAGLHTLFFSDAVVVAK